MELFLVALAMTVLYRIARALFRLAAGRRERESREKLLKDAETGRPGTAEPARWFGSMETPAVNGYSVPGGLVYVGEKLLDYSGFNDPCLLNPSLRAVSGFSPSVPLPEQRLHYGKMTPEQRGAYLSWLAGGRNDPDAALPYVFLFFYGLERRLMVDAQRGAVSPEERADIVLEILRLLQIYGEHRAFRGTPPTFSQWSGSSGGIPTTGRGTSTSPTGTARNLLPPFSPGTRHWTGPYRRKQPFNG